MTREEEIKQAASNYIKSDVVRAGNEYLAYGDFVNGVQWADEHPKSQWISVKERLPKKYDGRIRSNAVLVSITGDEWTVAEYHFGDKQWINLLGERETIEPEYWQEVELPNELQ